MKKAVSISLLVMIAVFVAAIPFSIRSIDDPTPVTSLAIVNGAPIVNDAEHPAGLCLPPEDCLTPEEREFRQKVIKAAGLDPSSPDFNEQLEKIYSATDSTQFPNNETYRLFIDRLAEINQNQKR